MSGELWRRSAVELADLLARGEASAREVLDAHLDRIARVNPAVNAIVTLALDRAADDAERADAAHARASGASCSNASAVSSTGTTCWPCPRFRCCRSPAISIPFAFSAGGLPVGVQLVAPPGHDLLLLQVAHAFDHDGWVDGTAGLATLPV